MKIGLFYGTTSAATQEVADLIQEQMSDCEIEVFDVFVPHIFFDNSVPTFMAAYPIGCNSDVPVSFCPTSPIAAYHTDNPCLLSPFIAAQCVPYPQPALWYTSLAGNSRCQFRLG